MDISARASSLADRPRMGHSGHQCSHAPGRPILHLVSSSRRPRRVRSVGLHHRGLIGRLRGFSSSRSSDGEHVLVQPLLGGLEPGLEPVALPGLGLDQHNLRRLDEQGPQVAIATLRYLAEDRAIPVEICLGTSPSQAAKARPLANASPAPMAATIALEMIGPIPGTLISRSQPASRWAMASISPDKASMRSSSRRQSPARSWMTCTMRGDRTSGGVVRMRGNSARKKRCPCRTATPCS